MSQDSQSDRNDKLDALLAEGRMSGPRRDAVLAGALSKSQPPRRRWAWLGFGSFSLVAAAAAVFLLMPSSGFRARGQGGAVLEVGCVGLNGDPGCIPGSTLLFRVSGATEGGFVTAWAEPTGPGERVWYFPTTTTPSPEVQKQAELQTLRQGVVIGAEQPRGTYLVHVLLTSKPLTHDQALEAMAKSPKPLGMVTTPLDIK